MKVVFFFLIVTTCLISCRNDAKQIPDANSSSEPAVIEKKAPKSLPYSVEYNGDTDEMTLVRAKSQSAGLSSNGIVELLNKKHLAIKLDFVKASGDTIFLEIDDAVKLTQEMGSAGAQSYLAEVTYAFTEVEGIKQVNLNFEEGDHAMPGNYKRSDFSEFKIVQEK
ncbi:MAG TPA: hypothetical protein VF602_10995 [Pedobacter sp.]|jgi:hypothetical protein